VDAQVPDCQDDHQFKNLFTSVQRDSQLLKSAVISHFQNNIPFLLLSQHPQFNNAFSGEISEL